MSKHTPGPWSVGYHATSIDCVNAKIGGPAKLFDVRAWGYLTGRGHGGLGLPDDEAVAIQTANASLAAAAPEMLAALKALLNTYVDLGNSGDAGFWDPEKEEEVIAARAAIAKAEGR